MHPPIFKCLDQLDASLLSSLQSISDLNAWVAYHKANLKNPGCSDCGGAVTICPAGFQEVIGGVKIYEDFDLDPNTPGTPDADKYNCLMTDVAQFFERSLYEAVVQQKYSTPDPVQNSNYYLAKMPIYLIYNQQGNRMPLEAEAKINWSYGDATRANRVFGEIEFALYAYPNCSGGRVEVLRHTTHRCENSGKGLKPSGTILYAFRDPNDLANSLKIKDVVKIKYDKDSHYMYFDFFAANDYVPYYYNGCSMTGSYVRFNSFPWGSTGTYPGNPSMPVTSIGTFSGTTISRFNALYGNYTATHLNLPVCNRFGSCNACVRWSRPAYIVNTIADLLPGEPGFTAVSACDPDEGLNQQFQQQQIENYFAACRQGKLDELATNYRTACMDNFSDNLQINYTLGYYHYTLYYYDRAGNLVTTVPPQGAKTNLNHTQDRSAHDYQTDYQYNSIKQLVSQSTPDGGTTRFWYNAHGQLVLSQSQDQKRTGTERQEEFSYTRYDQLGRIVEVGELVHEFGDPASAYNPDANRADWWSSIDFPNNWLGVGANRSQRDFTRTIYSTGSFTYNGQVQQNLRNRVSHTYTDQDGDLMTTNDQMHTYYSYDIGGNVQWVVHDLPGLPQKAILYEYDLVSGNVLKVSYNKGINDQYFHKYEYDADNRITKVYTSRDELVWDCDAAYEYYAHGPLKRMMLGEDKIQGIDYTYTIEGYLKSINQVELASKDPGSDGYGTSLYLKDEFAMELGYYQGDYDRNGVAMGAQGVNTVTPGVHGQSLFNGNISSWMYQTRSEADLSLGNPMDGIKLNMYRYDRLNRLKSNDFHLNQNGNWTAPKNYEEAFSYDANGNILTANRTAYDADGRLTIDALTYNYASTGTLNNRLLSVNDAIATPSGSTVGDLSNQTNANNYLYDGDGNLIIDWAEKTRIEWNTYGKVASSQ